MAEQPIRVLIVDDDEDDFIIVRDILNQSSTNYYTEWIPYYEQAQQYISTTPRDFDIYIIDYFLGNPNNHGLKLISELRVIDPFVPIILLTGVGDYNIDLQAMKLGATDYVVKDDQMFVLLGRSIRYSLQHARFLQSLANSQLRYRSLFEQSNDAVLLISLDGNFLQSNQRAAIMFQYQPADLNAMHFLNLVPEDAQTRGEQIFAALIKEGVFELYEGQLVKKDGTVFPAEINVELVTDEWRNPSHVQAIIRDISERKKLEEQRTQLELEQQQKANLMRLISSFSHDLRTPLAIINTSLYLLEELSDPAKQRAKIDMLRTHTQRLVQVIEDVLKIATFEFTTDVERSKVDLKHLLDAIPRQLIKNKSLPTPQIVFSCEEDQVYIRGDASMLTEAFTRILKNSFMYTHADGIVNTQIRTEEEQAVIQIIDNGDGIATDDLPYVFDHFYRADMARTLNMSGSGLGLPISKRIIELHKGTIQIDSQLDQGTTVTIIFPLFNPA